MIYLVRHGQTKWNKSSIFRGQSDIPLNETGYRQAQLTAYYMKEKNFNHVYSSPLSRSFETAKKIADAKGLEVEIVENFKDISFGDWEGKELEIVKSEDPKNYFTYRNDPEKASFPGGESLTQCFERSYRSFYNLILNNKDDMVIVTHRVIIKMILIGILNLSLKAFWQLQVDTCSITEIYQKDMLFVLRKMNDTCHLEDRDSLKPDF